MRETQTHEQMKEIKTMTIQTKKDYLKMFTAHNDDGKMEGFQSLNTSPLQNPHCMERSQNPELVCFECYSIAYNNYRANLRNKLQRNTELLTAEVIDTDMIPFINDKYFRIESFGDLQNVTQAINYLNLIIKNRETLFGWWTKNPQYIRDALDTLGIEKPENVQIIFSSPCVNHPIELEAIKNVFPFIDKVFTVWKDEQTAAEQNKTINCGSRKCIDCLNCYRKDGNPAVNELLK